MPVVAVQLDGELLGKIDGVDRNSPSSNNTPRSPDENSGYARKQEQPRSSSKKRRTPESLVVSLLPRKRRKVNSNIVDYAAFF